MGDTAKTIFYSVDGIVDNHFAKIKGLKQEEYNRSEYHGSDL